MNEKSQSMPDGAARVTRSRTTRPADSAKAMSQSFAWTVDRPIAAAVTITSPELLIHEGDY